MSDCNGGGGIGLSLSRAVRLLRLGPEVSEVGREEESQAAQVRPDFVSAVCPTTGLLGSRRHEEKLKEVDREEEETHCRQQQESLIVNREKK